MSSKQFTTISLAALATLSAFAMSVESASALPAVGGSFKNPNVFRAGVSAPKPPTSRHVSIHVHHRHVYRSSRYRWGVYAAPAYVAYAPACYFVRRPAGLFKVCKVY
jgi:hypothetical protein